MIRAWRREVGGWEPGVALPSHPRAGTRATTATVDALTRAKIRMPGPRPEWVDRTTLVDRLVAGDDKRLVLLAAPAGYGKSTLIAQWRFDVREPRPFAYLALDERDDDPARLWTSILVALDHAGTGLQLDDLLPPVRTPPLDPTLIDATVVPTLLERLARLTQPVVLVLDDFHTVRGAACRQQVTQLLKQAPPTCQLVIATRGTAPAGVARLRAAGEVLDVGLDDLRFSAAEIGPFVQRVAGRALAGPDLAALAARTEGWPAGTYLAALSLRDRPGPLAHSLPRMDRYILDYLSEEVLAGLTDETRRFLRRTSVLDRFTPGLCDAVAQTANAAEVLEHLTHTNLFLIALDGDRRWFRYHRLFALALRTQLTQEGRDLEASVHRIASGWLENAGLIDDAIAHAYAGGDPGRAIHLLAEHWPSYVDTGRDATVQRWLALIGDEALSRDPAGALCAAWFAAFAGDREAVRRWLQIAERLPHAGPLPDRTRSVASAAALIRATFGLEGHEDMLRHSRLAAGLEIDPASPWYGLAAAGLGRGLYLAGRARDAIAPLERAAQSQNTLLVVRILALSLLSLATGRLGRHVAASDLATAAHQLVYDHDLADSPQASLAFTALGAALARQGRLDAARVELEHSLRVRRRIRGVSPWPTLESLVILASVAMRQGDHELARALRDEADDLLAALPEEDHQIKADLDALRRRLTGNRGTPTLGVPLTKRERVVLRLLPGRLSRTQIARELFLSANTVKTHTRVIYRKLGVSSRQEAVRRARELGLL